MESDFKYIQNIEDRHVDFIAIISIFLISILIILGALFLIVFYYEFKAQKEFYLKIRMDFILKVVIAGAFLLGAILVLLVAFSPLKDQIVASAVAFLAVIGWLFTNYISAKNSIRQHTVATLTQIRLSTEYIKHTHRLVNKYQKSKIDSAFYEFLQRFDKDAAVSVTYFLNTLEFIAAGIRLGDFDETLIKNSQKSVFVSAFNIFGDFMKDKNTEIETTYEHLFALKERWEIN